jgi:Glycosyl transferase family 2
MIELNRSTQLAIVIPAYKDTYFREALSSIANQTCKDFVVYIGDDNSPFDLYKVVEEFEDTISIVYKKFLDNVGGKNLVEQWHRCIDMIQDEKWIWLFSDDDVMDSNCVEEFYNCKSKYDDQLFHFDVRVIDSESKVLYYVDKFPQEIYSPDLMCLKMKGKLCSYVVEYIFNRDLYEAKDKFEYFDLAWGSDDATWMKFLGTKGLRTIDNAFVDWRYSGSNISSGVGNTSFVYRKVNASLSYLSWVNVFFKSNGLVDKTSKYVKIRWLLEVVKISKLSPFDKFKLTSYICAELKASIGLKYFFLFYMTYSILKVDIKHKFFN